MAQQRTVLVRTVVTGLVACAVVLVASGFSAGSDSDNRDEHRAAEELVHQNAHRMIAEGKHTFRYETFGDEAFWGDTLKLHQAIAGAKQGGVGPGLVRLPPWRWD